MKIYLIEVIMNVKDRIVFLQQQHDDLDKHIKEEYIKYKDDKLVNLLKKKKLQIKDEIQQLKNGTHSDSN